MVFIVAGGEQWVGLIGLIYKKDQFLPALNCLLHLDIISAFDIISALDILAFTVCCI